jgi:hypothetical protein
VCTKRKVLGDGDTLSLEAGRPQSAASSGPLAQVAAGTPAAPGQACGGAPAPKQLREPGVQSVSWSWRGPPVRSAAGSWVSVAGRQPEPPAQRREQGVPGRVAPPRLRKHAAYVATLALTWPFPGSQSTWTGPRSRGRPRAPSARHSVFVHAAARGPARGTWPRPWSRAGRSAPAPPLRGSSRPP